MSAVLLNAAWMASCAPEAWRFRRACRDVAGTQARLLAQTLRDNSETWFGRKYDFARIRTPTDFRNAVPLATADDFADAIGRIGDGESNVLTAETVQMLEPTSGSTGGEKLIPYTRTRLRQLQRAVAVWVYDLFRHRPAVRKGRAYWSISPALGGPRRSPGGLPIGFDADSAYLGRLDRFILRRLLAVPDEVSHIAHMDAFRSATLAHLKRASDLAFISVWSPTFLTTLLAMLDRPPRELWPRLALVSCWADAASAAYVPELQSLLPGVEIQPKGLLATEGIVSIPLVGQPGAALAIRSHVFEFLTDDGQVRWAHELEGGTRYEVVLTTGGGLYRYRLRDLIEVVGRVEQCPLVRFVGKSDRTCDLVGEKLGEPFVRAVFARLGVSGFAMLVPVAGPTPHYRLYCDGPREPEPVALDAELSANPHYRYARGLGQLGPCEVRTVDTGWSRYEGSCVARGVRAGNVKPTALDGWPGWPDVFEP